MYERAGALVLRGVTIISANPGNAEFTLTLADGTHLVLRAGDASAARVVAFLARAAQLSPTPLIPTPLPVGEKPQARPRCLLAVTDTGQGSLLPHVSDEPSTDAEADIVCVLEPRDMQRPRRQQAGGRGTLSHTSKSLTEEQWLWVQLVRLSACTARETHSRGGVLLHSGLMAYPHHQSLSLSGREGTDRVRSKDEGGILLAGRSGVGKSTASRRFPPPWRALADDATLVVRDEQGTYWAHPWPTWSRFFGEEAGDGSDSWDVQQAVPLQAIIILEKEAMDRIEPLGPGHAVALLAELARQTSTYYLRSKPLNEIAAFNFQRFDNLCALVRAVPAHLLHVSLDGTFWTEIEQVLL